MKALIRLHPRGKDNKANKLQLRQVEDELMVGKATWHSSAIRDTWLQKIVWT